MVKMGLERIKWGSLKTGEKGAVAGALAGVLCVVIILAILKLFVPQELSSNLLLVFPLLLTIVLLSTLAGLALVKAWERSQQPWTHGFKRGVLSYGVLFLLVYACVVLYLWRSSPESNAWVWSAIAALFIIGCCGAIMIVAISKLREGRLHFLALAYLVFGIAFLLVGLSSRFFSSEGTNHLVAAAGIALLALSALFFLKILSSKR